MSADTTELTAQDMEKSTLEPLLHIRFTNDFTAVQVEGELEDPSSFGVTLMTALRSMQNVCETLSLGPISQIRGLDGETGFSLHLGDSGHNLKKFPGIIRWSDLDHSASPERQFPVLPTVDDLPGWLDQFSALRWRGLRTQADDEWSHHFNDSTLDESTISPFSLAVLQLDLLLRSVQLPRRQLQIIFADHTLWMAVNAEADFLMALSTSQLTPGGQNTVERCMSFFTWPL